MNETFPLDHSAASPTEPLVSAIPRCDIPAGFRRPRPGPGWWIVYRVQGVQFRETLEMPETLDVLAVATAVSQAQGADVEADVTIEPPRSQPGGAAAAVVVNCQQQTVDNPGWFRWSRAYGEPGWLVRWQSPRGTRYHLAATRSAAIQWVQQWQSSADTCIIFPPLPHSLG